LLPALPRHSEVIISALMPDTFDGYDRRIARHSSDGMTFGLNLGRKYNSVSGDAPFTHRQRHWSPVSAHTNPMHVGEIPFGSINSVCAKATKSNVRCPGVMNAVGMAGIVAPGFIPVYWWHTPVHKCRKHDRYFGGVAGFTSDGRRTFVLICTVPDRNRGWAHRPWDKSHGYKIARA